MNIPSRVNPFGYDNTIPPGYVRAEFLKGEGRQWLETNLWLTPQHDYDTTFSELDGDQAWGQEGDGFNQTIHVYRTQGLLYAQSTYNNALQRLPFNYNGEYATLKKRGLTYTLGDQTNTARGFDYQQPDFDNVTVKFCRLFTYLGNFNYHIAKGKWYSQKVWLEGKLVQNLHPALDTVGIPCMYDTITGTPFYNSGTGSDFILGLTTKQAINLANLPVPTTINTLTISLPLEAAFDANVQDALNTAADKGWTITVQYRESELTTKNIPADFLESTGTQWINSEVYPFAYLGSINNFGGKVRCQFPRFWSWAPSAESWVQVEEIQNSFSTIGIQVRGILYSSFGTTSYKMTDVDELLEVASELNFLNSRKFIAKSVQGYVEETIEEQYNNFESSKPIIVFGTNSHGGVGGRAVKIWNIAFSEKNKIVRDYIPTLDSTGTPCMYDTVSGQNFYKVGTGAFTVGFDTTEKAAISISKLPITTDGTLTVSLPAAAQDASSLVPEAINIATNRGWTIITQYRED